MPKYGKSKTHMVTAAFKNDSTATCCDCDFKTNSFYAFKLHKKFIHKKKGKENPDSKESFRCHACSVFFKSHKEVVKHSKTHKVGTCKK